MDTLTFGAPVLLRHLTFSEARKTPISQIHLSKALDGLEMSMDQFIELCLLLGCDYLEPIKGVGPKSALKLVREFESLDKVLEHLREKYVSDSRPISRVLIMRRMRPEKHRKMRKRQRLPPRRPLSRPMMTKTVRKQSRTRRRRRKRRLQKLNGKAA